MFIWNWKKLAALAATSAVAVVLAAVGLGSSGVALAGVDQTGNGAPSGPHYNLNIIGVPKDKTADMTGSNGHRIFVKLEGKTKIGLAEGDFQVIDANGTDGNGAKFQLPNPDEDENGVTTYSVWARAVGKPGGSSTTTTCGFDSSTTTEVLICSTMQLVEVRSKGKPTFTDVSKYLLYVYADLGDGKGPQRLPLFADELRDYYWDYDNNGLKVLQLRFYEVSSTVPAP